MFVKCVGNGMFGSSSYVVGANGKAVIIDAGVDPNKLLQILSKNNMIAKYVIVTHGHIDHICNLDKICELTGAEVAIHELDKEHLIEPSYNFSEFFGVQYEFKRETFHLLKDKDILKVGDMDFEIIHTPGHSPGSICIKVKNILFTGDTLFKAGIGRTDLRSGDFPSIINSLKKLMELPDDTVVYPGHGTSTSIKAEKLGLAAYGV